MKTEYIIRDSNGTKTGTMIQDNSSEQSGLAVLYFVTFLIVAYAAWQTLLFLWSVKWTIAGIAGAIGACKVLLKIA